MLRTVHASFGKVVRRGGARRQIGPGRSSLAWLLLWLAAMGTTAAAQPAAPARPPFVWGPNAHRGLIELQRPGEPGGERLDRPALLLHLPDKEHLEVRLPRRAMRCRRLRTERFPTGRPGEVGTVVRCLDQQGEPLAGAVLLWRGRRVRSVWAGALGWEGDPGERIRTRLRPSTDARGSEGLVMERFDERLAGCAGPRERLAARWRLDPRRGRWVPMPPPEPTPAGRTVGLEVLTEPTHQVPSPGGLPKVLRSRGGEETAGLLDGDEATGVAIPGPRQPLRLLLVRREGPRWPLEAIRLRLAGRAGRSVALRVQLAETSGSVAAEAELRAVPATGWLTLRPAEPLTGRCLELILSAKGRTRPRLAELRLLEGASNPDYVVQLVARLASADRDERADASARLGRLPPAQYLPALRAAWDQLDEPPRMAALPALLRAAVQLRRNATNICDYDEARWAANQAFLLLQRLPDGPFRQALHALAHSGADGSPILMSLFHSGNRKLMVAEAMAAVGRIEGLPYLVDWFAAEERWRRPESRRVLGRVELNEGGADLLSGWVTGLPPAVAAAMLQGLARHPSSRPWLVGLAQLLIHRADDFESRWRLLQVVRRLKADETLLAWLRRMARAEPWMLRKAAWEALAAQGEDVARREAARLLGDPYPRVRRAVLRKLPDGAVPVRRIARMARSDPWPMVRAEALRRAAVAPDALPLLRASLNDPSRTVRRVAVELLAERRAREAWPLVRARLADPGEWPGVLAAALGFARALCIAEAEEPAWRLVERARKPNAWDPDVPVALEAIELLGRLGTPSARRRLRSLLQAPPPFGPAARRALGATACGQQRGD